MTCSFGSSEVKASVRFLIHCMYLLSIILSVSNFLKFSPALNQYLAKALTFPQIKSKALCKVEMMGTQWKCFHHSTNFKVTKLCLRQKKRREGGVTSTQGTFTMLHITNRNSMHQSSDRKSSQNISNNWIDILDYQLSELCNMWMVNVISIHVHVLNKFHTSCCKE